MTRQQLLANSTSMELTYWRALYQAEKLESQDQQAGNEDSIPMKYGRPDM